MSREIKFRAYVKDIDQLDENEIPHKGNFIYGNLVRGDGYYFITSSMHMFNIGYTNFDWQWMIKKGSAEQFTGLKDSNGKEIYEGDVLENPKYRSVVKFGSGSFYADVIGAVNRFPLAGEWQTSVVIGNAHSNPELLEAAK